MWDSRLRTGVESVRSCRSMGPPVTSARRRKISEANGLAAAAGGSPGRCTLSQSDRYGADRGGLSLLECG